MINRTNIVLSVLLVGVVIATAAMKVDHSRPNFEFLPDMKYTPAANAYAANSVFANGRTLQTPVPKTIARGQMPLHYTATKEDALRAGKELVNPYRAADETAPKEQQAAAGEQLRLSVQRGGDVYRVFCISCHGPTGAGDGPVPKRGFPPPPSMLTGNSVKMADGQLFHILTYGQGSMSPLAAQLSPRQRWDVINHVRGMQKAAPTVETTPAAKGKDDAK